MNSKFTPGPWEISRDGVPEGHVQLTVYAESDGYRVATVFRENANAHLISSAPGSQGFSGRIAGQVRD